MTSLVGQLSRSGATEEEIVDAIERLHEEPEANGQRRNYAKDKEVATLYRLYRAYLRDESWYDLEGKYRLAILVLSGENPRIPWQQVYFSDFYSFDPLQLEFIKALDKHCDVQVGLMYDESRPQLFEAEKATYMYLAGFCQVERWQVEGENYAPPLRHFAENFGRNSAPVTAAGCVCALEFTSREDEMRWALTKVKRQLQAGVKAQDIFLAVRDFANYNGLRQLADEYGVPVSLPGESSLAVQPLAEFLLLLLTAGSDNRDGALAYFDLLTGALGKQIFTLDTEVAENLKQEIYFTRRSYAQQKCAEMLASAEIDDAALNSVNEFIENLPGKGCLADYMELLKEFIAGLNLEQRWGELYKAGGINILGLKSSLLSKTKLLEAMDALQKDYENCGQKEKRFTVAEVSEILTEALRDVQLTLMPGRIDGILLTEVFNVQGLPYKYVYLLGMREGEFPAGCSENWIYNDAERGQLTALGIDMPGTAMAYAEDAYFFAAAASQARQQLVLTWHRDDNSGMSPYVDKVLKLYSDVAVEHPAAQDKPFASAQELMQLGKQCDKKWLGEVVGSNTLTAAQADDARIGLNSYNGIIGDEELIQHIADDVGSSFSASTLEIYAACPFRFLGERVWQQEKFAEKSDTAEPMDEGNVLHAVLARFMGRHLREKLLKYDLQDLIIELENDFNDMCAEYKDKGAVADELLWQAEERRLKNMLRQWLYYEYEVQSKWESFVPYAVEWDFSSRNGKPLKLMLPDGDTVSILGRIDRVDSDGSRLFITDYKRGNAPTKKELETGFDLQLPVYLLAADALYGKGHVAGGGYLSLKDAQRKSSIAFEDIQTNGFTVDTKLFGGEDGWLRFKNFSQGLIADYITGIRNGQFEVQPKGGCSPFCPLRDICRLGAGEGGEGDDEFYG